LAGPASAGPALAGRTAARERDERSALQRAMRRLPVRWRILGIAVLNSALALILLFLIWDGAKIHHCREVKAFLSAGASARLRLIRLPAYAPELNPDENVWRWLKRQLGNLCCRDFVELRYELGLAIRRLRRRPQVLRACFEKAGLQI